MKEDKKIIVTYEEKSIDPNEVEIIPKKTESVEINSSLHSVIADLINKS